MMFSCDLDWLFKNFLQNNQISSGKWLFRMAIGIDCSIWKIVVCVCWLSLYIHTSSIVEQMGERKLVEVFRTFF